MPGILDCYVYVATMVMEDWKRWSSGGLFNFHVLQHGRFILRELYDHLIWWVGNTTTKLLNEIMN